MNNLIGGEYLMLKFSEEFVTKLENMIDEETKKDLDAKTIDCLFKLVMIHHAARNSQLSEMQANAFKAYTESVKDVDFNKLDFKSILKSALGG